MHETILKSQAAIFLLVPRQWLIVICLVLISLTSEGQSRLDSLVSQYNSTTDTLSKLDLCFSITETAAYQEAPAIALKFNNESQRLLELIDPNHPRYHYLKLMTEVGRAINIIERAALAESDQVRDSSARVGMDISRGILSEAESRGLEVCEAWAYYNLGEAYQRLALWDSSKVMFLKAHQISKSLNDKKLIAWTGYNLSEILGEQGVLVLAIKYLQFDLNYSIEIGDSYYQMETLCKIGQLYNKIKDTDVALSYFLDSRDLAVALNNKKYNALTNKNIGLSYGMQGELDSALYHGKLALTYGLDAEVYNNIGIVYRKKFERDGGTALLDSSFIWLKEAFDFQSSKNKKASPVTCANLAAYYSHRKDLSNYRKWEARFRKSIDHNETLYNGDQYELMGMSAARLGLFKDAFRYMEMFNLINESAHIRNQSRQAASVETEMLFIQQIAADSLARQKELFMKEQAHSAEIRSTNRKRNMALTVGAFFILISIGLLSRTQILRKSREAINHQKEEAERQRERSDDLLLNILPVKVAEELKATGSSEAQSIASVTVLFTDFVGFTHLSQSLSPEELISEINECFSEFDKIVERHGVEKIKTIGDAYMAAGGLPEPNDSHAADVLAAAVEIQAFMKAHAKLKKAAELPYFDIRIGIHTGPVIAGIVGLKKFQYDIWGDTVNTASRMESAAIVGSINLSKSTYEKVKEDTKYAFEFRGKIDVKGKGELEMYCLRA